MATGMVPLMGHGNGGCRDAADAAVDDWAVTDGGHNASNRAALLVTGPWFGAFVAFVVVFVHRM